MPKPPLPGWGKAGGMGRLSPREIRRSSNPISSGPGGVRGVPILIRSSWRPGCASAWRLGPRKSAGWSIPSTISGVASPWAGPSRFILLPSLMREMQIRSLHQSAGGQGPWPHRPHHGREKLDRRGGEALCPPPGDPSEHRVSGGVFQALRDPGGRRADHGTRRALRRRNPGC